MEQLLEHFHPSQLDYGTIYIFSALYTPYELVENYMQVMTRACQQSEALSRFSTKIIYSNTPPTLVARRFNAGNIGKESILSCPVCGDINIDEKLVSEFIKRLFDFKQLDSGDNHIKITDFLNTEQQKQMYQAINEPDLLQKLDNSRTRALFEQEELPNKSPKDIEERELVQAENQRNIYLEIIGQLVINYVSIVHRDPHELLGDTINPAHPLTIYSQAEQLQREQLQTIASPIVFTSKKLSPLVIDGDLKLHLTNYENAEVRLHPLSKALYILFLLHLRIPLWECLPVLHRTFSRSLPKQHAWSLQ